MITQFFYIPQEHYGAVKDQLEFPDHLPDRIALRSLHQLVHLEPAGEHGQVKPSGGGFRDGPCIYVVEDSPLILYSVFGSALEDAMEGEAFRGLVEKVGEIKEPCHLLQSLLRGIPLNPSRVLNLPENHFYEIHEKEDTESTHLRLSILA
tara:strand:+ start:5801 stop:6250 length:450 start_codon:yes stop_codon:yes gene_type:complete